MAAQNRAHRNGSTHSLSENLDSELPKLAADGEKLDMRLESADPDVAHLQEAASQLAAGLQSIVADRHALRQEVAMLHVELARLESQLNQNARSAAIVAKITNLVQDVEPAPPPPSDTPEEEEGGLPNVTEPGDGQNASSAAPHSFLELLNLTGPDSAATTSPVADPDPIRPATREDEAASQPDETVHRQRLAATDEPARASGRSWLARTLGWASVAGVGVAVAFVLLLTAGPKVFPYQTYYVYGKSMEPTIPVGSMIVLDPVAFDQVQVGDVITVERPDAPGSLVTHRVIGFEDTPEGLGLVTQGDANETADNWRVRAEGEGYRLRFSIPHLGYVLYTLQSPIGRLGLLVIPAVALGGLLLAQLWRAKPMYEPTAAIS